ncbi:Lrp/AsnC family transcriptional regulator [Spiroplasma sp. DGKH1]|uniref:Lrp/AsnC family transcriptional regulator n=1 Tax=Spiroplasma sp. DGKH1 TaxID=3050074 RepID=UPI0034C6447F
MKQKVLTKIDYQIIKHLNKNALTSNNQIAKELNVSQKTIKAHVDWLIKNKVIRPVAIVNSEFFGYNIIVDVFIWTKKQVINDEIKELCTNSSNVVYFSKHWSNETISLQAKFKTFNELTIFLEEIRALENVERIKYSIIPKVFFDNDSWIPSENDFSNK